MQRWKESAGDIRKVLGKGWRCQGMSKEGATTGQGSR